MSTLAFDTHKAVKALKEAGFDDPQAEAVVSTVDDAIGGTAATKADITELKADIERLRQATKGDLTALEARAVKWLVPLLLGQAAIIVALVKLL